jgi:hypothetical protein
MTHKSDAISNTAPVVLNLVSWFFGFIVFAIGSVNTFWGNDPGFGIFLILLAFLYFPPIAEITKKWTGLTIRRFVKIALGIFIIWASLGVGELFDKIRLMTMDL